ncbi:solute carrier family 46 member 3-like [Aricia agestis]|uniref:solute carrier family 46 member 3-like n=1 Tax=Aricia agestis TaxID=91739 RepID=UPI001C2082EB|nr:solute carrier family 46 member 3-like [Aricia agestis]
MEPDRSAENEPREYVETDPLRGTFEVEETKKRSFKETCGYVFRNITVEPSMIMFVTGYTIYSLVSQNLSLEKACRVNLNFTEQICDSLKLQTVESENQYERQVQQLVTKMLAYKTYITATIPSFLALFIGSFSDKTGYRKMFIIISVAGQLCVVINNIVNVYFITTLPLEVMVYTDAVIDGITGAWCSCALTVFAFIGAITTTEERTLRLGLINFCMTVGFPIGLTLSGSLLSNIGYYGCYGLAGGLHVINLAYNIFILRDPPKTEEQKSHNGKGLCHYLRVFFDFTNIKETFRVVFKNGPNNRRVRIILMLITVAILFGPMHGELSIMYLFTRYRFNWDEVMFSIFQTYNFVTHTIGTIFSIVLLSKYLQWHDSILGIISTVSKIAGSFIYCFAPNEKIFFIAPLVDTLNGMGLLAVRSLTSKLVAVDELGKVNSIFALSENLMPLVYIPLYTMVYAATMEVLPGAVFLMGSAMTIPALIVFIWILVDYKLGIRKEKSKTPVD